MRSIIVWEKDDEQIRWAFEKDTKITCRVRVVGCHRDLQFDVDEWEARIREGAGDLMVSLDYNNMLVLDEDEMKELLLEHREKVIDVDAAVAEVEELSSRLSDALECMLQDMIENRAEHTIDYIEDARDAILRRLSRIVDDLENGVW